MNVVYRKQDMHRLWLGIKGFFRCIGLLNRNRRTHYVITTFGVGDALLACAYLRAYKQAYDIAHLTLIGKKSMRDVFQMYEGEYDELLLLDDSKIVQLSDAFLFDWAYRIFYRWLFRITPAVIICHIKNFEMATRRSDNWLYSTTTMRDLYKALLFMLPADAKAELPDTSVLPDVHEMATSCGAVPGKSVVLSPHAFSVKKVDMAFWEELCRRLEQAGYVCFTNTFRPGEKAIGDTRAVSFGLKETAAFIQHCGSFVALRSGMCDLAQYTDCNLAVIYPDHDTGGTRHFYGLADHDGIAKVREFSYDEAGKEKLISEICSFIVKE